jgi:hypothetical protein
MPDVSYNRESLLAQMGKVAKAARAGDLVLIHVAAPLACRDELLMVELDGPDQAIGVVELCEAASQSSAEWLVVVEGFWPPAGRDLASREGPLRPNEVRRAADSLATLVLAALPELRPTSDIWHGFVHVLEQSVSDFLSNDAAGERFTALDLVESWSVALEPHNRDALLNSQASIIPAPKCFAADGIGVVLATRPV